MFSVNRKLQCFACICCDAVFMLDDLTANIKATAQLLKNSVLILKTPFIFPLYESLHAHRSPSCGSCRGLILCTSNPQRQAVLLLVWRWGDKGSCLIMDYMCSPAQVAVNWICLRSDVWMREGREVMGGWNVSVWPDNISSEYCSDTVRWKNQSGGWKHLAFVYSLHHWSFKYPGLCCFSNATESEIHISATLIRDVQCNTDLIW